jgi:hypothetical protein
MSEKPILIEVQSFNGIQGDGFRSAIIEAPAGSTDTEIERLARAWYDERHTFSWKRSTCQRKGGCNSLMTCKYLKGCFEEYSPALTTEPRP